MKKNIVILGSTGSIGKTLLKIINKNKNNYNIVLLTANTDYKTLLKQAKKFNVKNLIINDYSSFLKLTKIKDNSINIYKDFNSFNKIIKTKVDYVISGIVGLNGLHPTYEIIKYTKTIAIANKETLVCAWSLIQKRLKKYKVRFIPVDSEHFSLWFGLKGMDINSIDKIYITASGGPLLNCNIKHLSKVDIHKVTNHPNWKMGKKISTDSATMMNKVFEVIEAKNIFEIPLNKIEILIHPQSYIHAIIKFKNGLIKLIAHETTMEIPIYNSLYHNLDSEIKSKNISLNLLNNLKLQTIDLYRFPLVNILKKLNSKVTLYETIIVSTNDYLVSLFLNKKIKFNQIPILLFKIINNPIFRKFKFIKPKSINEILDLNKYVHFKIKSKSV